MSSTSRLHRFFAPAVRLLSLSALLCSLLGCHQTSIDPEQPDEDRFADTNETIVLQTDSDEWRVRLFYEHLLYAEAVQKVLPAPWKIPTKEDATVLKTLEYPHTERFITSDGYTFGMPSASVSKAGAKTKYSVLGLHRQRTVIRIEF